MTMAGDHSDNARFNAIVKSSLLESMYIVNQEKHPIQMEVTTAMLSLFCMGLLCINFAF